jgi:hypothetical protein
VRAALLQAFACWDGASPDLALVNDPQRATASPEVLRRTQEMLDLSRTRVLVATGSHRFDAAQRLALERLFEGTRTGAWDWHDARRSDLFPIGGSDGWRAHPWLAQAHRVLTIGSVEPHYFAGFSGAHKTATIGCAAYPDIERNHAGAMNPVCRPCRLAGTPVHEGVLAMLARLEADRSVRAVNLFQTGSGILDAAGGTPLEALTALTPAVEAACLRRIGRPADALVVEVTGALSCSFYQAEKGIKNSEAVVRDGGAIVLQAACPQGIGQDAFVQLLREAQTHREAVDLVTRRGYRLGDHKAVRLRYLTDPACRGVRVWVVSPGLSGESAAVLGVHRADTVESALREAGVDPAGSDVYRVEDAGNTCVVLDAG